jgi:hypothetical protein
MIQFKEMGFTRGILKTIKDHLSETSMPAQNMGINVIVCVGAVRCSDLKNWRSSKTKEVYNPSYKRSIYSRELICEFELNIN